jgi:hypothetical protein
MEDIAAPQPLRSDLGEEAWVVAHRRYYLRLVISETHPERTRLEGFSRTSDPAFSVPIFTSDGVHVAQQHRPSSDGQRFIVLDFDDAERRYTLDNGARYDDAYLRMVDERLVAAETKSHEQDSQRAHYRFFWLSDTTAQLVYEVRCAKPGQLGTVADDETIGARCGTPEGDVVYRWPRPALD